MLTPSGRSLVPTPSRAVLHLGLALVVAAAPTTRVRATVRDVPSTHATIGAALAVAAPGDTIAVAAGTYSPATNGESFPLVVAANGVTLLGSGMGQTILDAAGTGSVLLLTAPGAGRVSGFTIQGGRADRGGGIHLMAGDHQIDHNLLLGNGARRRGGGVYVGGGTNPWIHHNVVWECFDSDLVDAGDPHGIQLGEASTGLVEHNLVGRGDSNGLIYSEGSAPVVRHNIFFENGTPGVRGRGICALGDNANAVVAHNLFWGNAIAAFIITGLGNVSAAAGNDADLQDGIYGNLDADPLLVDPELGDFGLQPGSPAIDAGDPQLVFDPDGTIADVGPFYFHQTASQAPPAGAHALLTRVAVAPNPFNPATQVLVELSRGAHLRVEIVDLRGRRVRVLHDGPIAAGAHSLRWDGRDDGRRAVASGAYLVSVRGAGESSRVALALLR